MNTRYTLGVALIFAAPACALRFDDRYDDSFNTAGGGEQDEYSQEIPSISASSTSSSMYLDPWDCGTELIKIESPDGSIDFVEVPLPCNPIQDVYRGCPIEKSSEHKSISNSFVDESKL